MDGAKEFVESTLTRPVVFGVVSRDLRSDMPLSGHVGAITSRLESFSNGGAFFIKVSLVLGNTVVPGHVSDPGLMGV